MTNIVYEYIESPDTKQKFALMEFAYNHGNSFILSTFGYLWESRQWWGKQPILVAKLDASAENNILGLHAFSVNQKTPHTLKTYYIITHKNFRGQGIAKQLTIKALKDYRDECSTFFVNSEEFSDGISFYKKLFDNTYTTSQNEFGTFDFNFETKIPHILKKYEL
jgi:ribosomal protein S18 acetylase RimI-like enzyme